MITKTTVCTQFDIELEQHFRYVSNALIKKEYPVLMPCCDNIITQFDLWSEGYFWYASDAYVKKRVNFVLMPFFDYRYRTLSYGNSPHRPLTYHNHSLPEKRII